MNTSPETVFDEIKAIKRKAENTFQEMESLTKKTRRIHNHWFDDLKSLVKNVGSGFVGENSRKTFAK
jgi:hypothetical protein